MRLPQVDTVEGGVWSARGDIDSRPDLELVLPARKEAVETPFLEEMREAARFAVYRAMAQADPAPRVAWTDWHKAKEAGIEMPEPPTELRPWQPAIADTDYWDERSTFTAVGSDALVMPANPEPPEAQAAAAATLAFFSGARISHLAMAGAIGLLVPLGWIGTGFLLLDDFDPIPVQSMGFTGPMADTLFWTVAATSIPAGFGTGLAAGVLVGSLVAALAAGEFRWQSLEGPRQTGRYLAGAVMMGVGGVLAGGCTVGAGLSGVSTASFAALLALAAMAASARAVGVLLAAR